MSHELRSPINSVISLATLQKDSVADQEKYPEYSDKIITSARYLLGVINDVLRIEAGMQTLIAKPIDTNQLYEQLDQYIGQTKN